MAAKKPLCTVNAVVEAPCGLVAALLTTVSAGPVGPHNGFFLAHGPDPDLRLRGGPNEFWAAIAGNPNGIRVEVDRAQAMLAVEGKWWFRAECRVLPHPKGARMTQQVFNIATSARWMVPMVARGVEGKQRGSMQRLLDRISGHLGCPAYLE
ncbi:hypothetical protein [Nocardia sp. NPDC049707]|uniref:hypothetical protein n=1 Tax=Nocardia sp. NPDC049707 TaxID=3154735 RepID=UPI003445F9F2